MSPRTNTLCYWPSPISRSNTSRRRRRTRPADSRHREEFIELYWRQGAPYGNSVADGSYNILQQNTGAKPHHFHRRRSSTSTWNADAGQAIPAWAAAVTEAVRLVREMPLWRLQRLRNEVLDFLYAESPWPATYD